MRGVATVLATLLALAAPAGAAAAPQRASLPDIEDEVMCVTCNVPLNIAESPQASRQRELIRDLVARGMTKEQVKDRLVAEYGEDVLALPRDDGVGLAAYAVPIAVVAGLLAALAFVLPRGRRRGAVAAATPAAAGAGPSAAESRRLEQDLARYDRGE
jgi:cytochrome c-type biogenesis protein CcmH